MTDAEYDRLQRDITAVVTDMRVIQAKLYAMDSTGTSAANFQFLSIQKDVQALEEALRRQEESKGADRRVMLGALLAAGTALAMAVIGVLIQIVTRHP